MLVLMMLTIPMTGFRTAEVASENSIGISQEVIVKQISVSEIEFNDEIFVTSTIYHAVEAQCDSTPTITASGAIIDTARATELQWCAISWDLHQRYGGPLKFGDVIEVKGTYGKNKINGKYIVQDLMSPKWTQRVDILRHPKDGGQRFDSVKIKHKKFKEYKKQKFIEAKKKGERIQRQVLIDKFQKLASKIPFIGTDVLSPENYSSKKIELSPQDNTDSETVTAYLNKEYRGSYVSPIKKEEIIFS